MFSLSLPNDLKNPTGINEWTSREPVNPASVNVHLQPEVLQIGWLIIKLA